MAAHVERPCTQPLVLDGRRITVKASILEEDAGDIVWHVRIRRFQNLTRKLIPPVNWLRFVCAPLTPKASAPAKSPRISGRMSRHLNG